MRRNANAPAPNPQNRQDIVITEELRRTKTNPAEEFLLIDTGANDVSRILVFASETDLHRLALW